MIELITGKEVNEKLGNYAARKICYQYRQSPMTASEMFGPYVAVGIVSEDKFLGAVIWHHYFPKYRTIEASIATEGPGWATRKVLMELFAYPFEQLNCQKVRAIAGRRNKSACKAIRGMGFKFEGNDRRGMGNDDAIIFGLLRKECKWLKTNQIAKACAPIGLSQPDRTITDGQSQNTSST